MIKKCTCKHTIQDKKYGEGRRVHNETKISKGDGHMYRCTVCLKEK